MEPIKVSIDVTLDFSENAKSFLASILTHAYTCNSVLSPEEHAKLEAPVTAEEHAKPEASVATEESAAKPEVSAAAEEPEITIEDVRKILQVKVNDHRPKIKEKLSELGAPSVTKLEKSKYQEMYNFLISL